MSLPALYDEEMRERNALVRLEADGGLTPAQANTLHLLRRLLEDAEYEQMWPGELAREALARKRAARPKPEGRLRLWWKLQGWRLYVLWRHRCLYSTARAERLARWFGAHEYRINANSLEGRTAWWKRYLGMDEAT